MNERRAAPFLFEGYWEDIGTVRAFFEANLPGSAIVLVKLHGGVRSLPGFSDLVRITTRERLERARQERRWEARSRIADGVLRRFEREPQIAGRLKPVGGILAKAAAHDAAEPGRGA